MLGLAQSGTTYAVVYGVIARNVAPEKRSWAMGITAAAGSFGQFLMVPVESGLIGGLGWQNALYVLGLMSLIIIPLALGLREPAASTTSTGPRQSVGAALREAFAYPSFRWLTAGYFVCGFQVVFIGVHMPSYLKDHGLSPNVATTALALIGLFNVIGTYTAGVLGQRMWRRRTSWPPTTLLRAVVISDLRAGAADTLERLPLLPQSMGLLWLSTVPPTNAIVAQIFGVQYMSMLGGFVFLSHQLGSASWVSGSVASSTTCHRQLHAVVWWIAVALSVSSRR